MNVDIVAISIQASVKYQRSIHEWAGVDKTTSLTNLHFFNIKHKASIKDLECQCWFTSEDQNLVISNLVSKAHIGRHPFSFINKWCWNFLPNISWNIIALNSIYYLLLIHSTSKSENVVVFKWTKTHTCPWNSHWINFFPLVLLSIVLFTVSIYNIVYKCTYYIDKSINTANRVVSMCFIHVCNSGEWWKDLIIAIARIQIQIVMFNIATC